MRKMNGAYAAIVTPFDEKEGLNTAALEALVERNLAGGVSGLYVCGSTGESYMLSFQERKQFLETVVKAVNGRCQVVVHTGAFSLRHAIELGKHAADLGADAISSVPPFYFPFSKEELADYYLELARAVHLPVLVYNVPALSGIAFTDEELASLLRSPEIGGIKQTSMNLFQTEYLTRTFPEKSIVNGHDEIYLQALTAGVESCIGSTVNIMPELFVQLKRCFDNGELDQAREIQSRINKVVRALCEVGVFKGVKAVLKMQGTDCGECRKPFKPLPPTQLEKLRRVMEEAKVPGFDK